MEQEAWAIHEVLEELQQVLERGPSTNDDQGDDHVYEHGNEFTGVETIAGDNNDNGSTRSAPSEAQVRRNIICRCLRRLDLALSRIVNTTTEQQRHYEQGKSPLALSLSWIEPYQTDLVTIVAGLDLHALGVEDDQYLQSTYQSLFRKTARCLHDYKCILDQNQAVQVMNSILVTLLPVHQQQSSFLSASHDLMDRTRGLLGLLNHALLATMAMEHEQQHSNDLDGVDNGNDESYDNGDGFHSSRSGMDDARNSHSEGSSSTASGGRAGTVSGREREQTSPRNNMARTSYLEMALGGNFDTLDFLCLFLPLASACLRDQNDRVAGESTNSQHDSQGYLLEPHTVHVHVWTFVDFLLQHIQVSMAKEQCKTLDEYVWVLHKHDQEGKAISASPEGGNDDSMDNPGTIDLDRHDADATSAKKTAQLVRSYASDLLESAFDVLGEATSYFQTTHAIHHDSATGEGGSNSTCSSNGSSGGGENCSKSTPSSLTNPSSMSDAPLFSNSNESAAHESEAEVQDMTFSRAVAKMANCTLMVCTALQVIQGPTGTLDPIMIDSTQSLWVAYTKAFLAAKESQGANSFTLSDDAIMGGTDALMRQGVLAMSGIQTMNTENNVQPLDPELQHALSIALLAALEFPQLLMENVEFLTLVEKVSAHNSELRHLVQGVALRGLVFPTSGSIRDPVAMEQVMQTLVRIGKTSSATSRHPESVIDHWDRFFHEQVAKQTPAVSSGLDLHD